VIAAQDVGALRHEVHAAEDDEFGVGMGADLARQLERVAGVVGELDHFVALVMMAEDDETAAEPRFRRGDARVHFVIGETEVFLRERLTLREVFFFVGGEDWQHHVYGFGRSARASRSVRSSRFGL
jgi:hypothetical protein